MLTVELLIVLVAVWCFWLYERNRCLWRHIAKFPGPPTIPILGNALQVGRKPEDYFSYACRLCKEFNFQPFRVYLGPQPYIVLSDTKHVETILSSPKLTYKADMYKLFRPWLGDGIFTSNGHKWSQHRKMIIPSFHYEILQDFLNVMNETTDRFMTFLGTFAETGEIFDFQEIITRSTIEIISECALGTRLNAIDGEPARVVKAMNEVTCVILKRAFSTISRYDFFFQFTKEHQIQNEAIKIIQEDFTKIIEERRDFWKNNKNNLNSKVIHSDDAVHKKRRKLALLDNLLTGEVNGRPLTFQEVFEETATLIFGGHDTIATTLTFAAYCLSRHPEVQQRAYEEQLSILGTDTKRNPNYQELQDMKYLEMVIKETLRIYPSAPFLGRTMAEDTQINDFISPKNVTVLVSILSLSTNEKNFEDPFVFRPERFEKAARNAVNAFAYVPFSAGPRNCIGQKFAMMELKVTISKLLRHFHILPPVDGLSKGIYDHGDPTANPRGPYDPQLAVMVTLKSINGIPLRLRKRAHC